MGRDKLGLTVGDKRLVRHVYDALQGNCEEILVVGSGEVNPSEGLEGPVAKKVRLVSDLRPGRAGPLAGIEAGLAAARNDRVFVAAGDMPFVPEALVSSLLEAVDEAGVRVAVPRFKGRLHPLCAAYRREVLADLSFALNLGVRAVHEFLESISGVRHVEEELTRFGEPDLFLMNVNSPQDLELARRVLGDREL